MKRAFIIIIPIIAALLPAFGSLSCSQGYSGPPETITLGMQIGEAAIPIFIAQDREFFTQNGRGTNILK